MKGKKFLPIIALVAFAVTSCDLTFPSKFVVKTKANYNFTIAKVNAKLSDYFNPAEIIPVDESSPFRIYDYNPATGNPENIQQFMIRMPIQEIPIDFSSYLSSTDLGSSLEAMNISQDVEIPTVALKTSKVIEASAFNKIVNGLIALEGYSQSSVEVILEGGSFDEAYYKNGEFIVQSTEITSGYVSLVIVDNSENVISTIGRSSFSGGMAVINLADKVLSGKYTRLMFETDTDKKFVAGINPDSVCTKVTGLTVNNDFSQDINLTIDGSSLGSNIESIIFGNDCSISLDYKLPSGWTGVEIKQDVSLSGGLNLNKTKSDELPYSLNNVEFTCSDINADFTIHPIVNNATLVFGEDITADFKVNVNTLKNVVLKAPDVSTSINVNQSLPEEATNMINKILWNSGTGIKVTYTNTFPAGNDFALNGVKSDFLGLSEKSEVLAAGQTNKVVNFVTTSETSTTISAGAKIDFTGNMILPGASAGKIIMKNVVAGEKYKLAIKVEPVLDWKEISVNNGSTRTQQQIAIEFNKTSIFKEIDNSLHTTFSDNLNLSSMPVHLYCEVPNIKDMFTDPHFEGSIKAYIADVSGSTITKDSTKGEITLLDGKMELNSKNIEPVLKFDDNKSLITEMKGGLESDFAPLVNKADEGQQICVDYDMTFATGSSGSEIVIEKSKLAGAKSTSMKIVAVIILPLDVENKMVQQIDLLELSGKDPSEDLFGRTEEPNYNRIADSLEIVEYVKVSFKPESPFFIASAPITVDVDIDGDKSNYTEQHINIAGGYFQVDDPVSLLQIYPLYPSAKITLPVGRFAIPRDAAFNSPLRVSVQTNGSFDLFGGNNE